MVLLPDAIDVARMMRITAAGSLRNVIAARAMGALLLEWGKTGTLAAPQRLLPSHFAPNGVLGPRNSQLLREQEQTAAEEAGMYKRKESSGVPLSAPGIGTAVSRNVRVL
jgi:hypothetical protein